MPKIRLLQALPPLIGLVLIAVAYVDSVQFGAGQIDAQTMLDREIPIALTGFGAAAMMFLTAVVSMVRRDPANAALSFASAFSFLVLFGIGGIFTPAYLFAT